MGYLEGLGDHVMLFLVIFLVAMGIYILHSSNRA